MKLWIGRMTHGYDFAKAKEVFDQNTGFPEEVSIYFACAAILEKYSDIRLEPGEVRRVKRIIIELED